MLEKEKIDRINFLAKKSKNEGLNETEKSEQAILRKEFLADFRNRFKQQLENIEFVEDIEDENKRVEKGKEKN